MKKVILSIIVFSSVLSAELLASQDGDGDVIFTQCYFNPVTCF